MQGAYKEALAAYTRALRAHPGAPAEVRLGLAACHFRLGRLPAARAAFQRTLDLSPGCAEALLGLAVIAFAGPDPERCAYMSRVQGLSLRPWSFPLSGTGSEARWRSFNVSCKAGSVVRRAGWLAQGRGNEGGVVLPLLPSSACAGGRARAWTCWAARAAQMRASLTGVLVQGARKGLDLLGRTLSGAVGRVLLEHGCLHSQGRARGPGPAVPRIRRGRGPPRRAGAAGAVQPGARRHRPRQHAGRRRRRGGRRG